MELERMAAAAARLDRDLRSAPFPVRASAVVDLEFDTGRWRLEGDGWWAEVSANNEDDDVEGLVLELVNALDGTLWPQNRVEPWPVCPWHGDHALTAVHVSGRAIPTTEGNSRSFLPCYCLQNPHRRHVGDTA